MVIEEISKEFEMFPYQFFWQLKNREKKFDVGYFIKAGFDDGQIFKSTPSIVHSVFQEYEPHGDYYLYVSEWLADLMRSKSCGEGHSHQDKCRTKNCSNFEYLDHAVSMPETDANLRSILQIPTDDIVGVRYGGFDTFDIDWVKEALLEILDGDSRFHLVFANTRQFLHHPRAHFLSTIFEPIDKSRFLKTGNFFIHARKQGESFGLAILESISVGIPVITFCGGLDLNHLNLVPEDLRYSDSRSLKFIIGEKRYLNQDAYFGKIKARYEMKNVGKQLEDYIIKASLI